MAAFPATFPAAVILDVDGTLVDSERDGHRVAFNLGFEEAGLPDRWDESLYGRLLETAGGQNRLDRWFRERGMPEDERRDLVPRLQARKTALFIDLVDEGRVGARPGVRELLSDMEEAGIRLAIATTGSREWVEPLLAQQFASLDRFEVIVAGDDVDDRKPSPKAHQLTLDKLGLTPADALALEDSDNGLRAAKAAGLVCVVVTNDYTRGQDLSGADVVLDGFGTPDAPATVVADPHAVEPPGRLDVATLRRLAP